MFLLLVVIPVVLLLFLQPEASLVFFIHLSFTHSITSFPFLAVRTATATATVEAANESIMSLVTFINDICIRAAIQFAWFYVPYAHDLCSFVYLCVFNARFASLKSLLLRFIAIVCFLLLFFLSFFKLCIQCMPSVVHIYNVIQCMRSRLYASTHTNTAFLLDSIALIKYIWNLSFFPIFPSFFIFECFVWLCISYDFVLLCHSFTQRIVPFYYFHGTYLLLAAI